MYEERIARARELFMEGYNCSQSVVLAFADLYGFSREQALVMSASFGGGIGRMRLTCGAACGIFMLAGLQSGSTDPKDRMGKARCYEVVRQLAKEFKEEMGSITCGELLGMKDKEESAVPQQRDAAYYKKRPCPDIVERAARIFACYLEKQA